DDITKGAVTELAVDLQHQLRERHYSSPGHDVLYTRTVGKKIAECGFCNWIRKRPTCLDWYEHYTQHQYDEHDNQNKGDANGEDRIPVRFHLIFYIDIKHHKTSSQHGAHEGRTKVHGQ